MSSFFRLLKTGPKPLFFRIQSGMTNDESYAVCTLIGAQSCYATGRIPDDFNKLLALDIEGWSNDTTFDLSWVNDYGALGQSKINKQNSGNQAQSTIADRINGTSIIASFPDVKKNDCFGVKITGTAGKTYHIIGISGRYT